MAICFPTLRLAARQHVALVHFKPFATGSMYLTDVAYYLSATMLSLFLSVRALAWR